MNRETLPYQLQTNYNMDLGLLNISPLFIQLLSSTKGIIRPAAEEVCLAHTLPHMLEKAIALLILTYREFQTKNTHQFIHNMHTGTMFALTVAMRELCSSGDTAGFIR